MMNTLAEDRAAARAHPAPPPRAARRALRTTIASTAIAASLAGAVLSAAPALADPEQGGVIPESTPDQGGVAPEAPPVAPPPVSPPPQTPPPSYDPGPGVVPAPPQEAPYQPYVAPTYNAPTYDEAYNPAPPRAYTLPRPVAPVRPIAPPPKTLRVGNVVVEEDQLKRDAPWLTDRQRNSINAWAAYGEAKIAQGLISVGVPEDEASRQAAATIIGVVLGGTTGAAAAGIPAAVVGGLGGAAIGAGIGFAVGSVPLPGPQTGPSTAAGAGIGAAAGAALLGIPAAIAGGVVGGVAGGVIAHALGAGDPGARPDRPRLPGEPEPVRPQPRKQQQVVIDNPEANQYEVHLPADQAARAGLPAVHYQVNMRGDVNAQINVGGRNLEANWSGEQARAPYAVLGAAKDQAEKTVNQWTRQASDQLKQVVPGIDVAWPQEKKPAGPGPRHARH
ncbi:hypothetical protein O4158_22095 [Gordonia amicalis]|uniref:hypothetical protein n=1 Tax=Gordonia amicalis TaxID=89053 RepID=UPI0022B44ADD|nr:hypothetical protein [Gordonia amicalis]MCZ4581729.1 hypothetical protein [Gordonia amicalis]